jgi:hypothetical protein
VSKKPSLNERAHLKLYGSRESTPDRPTSENHQPLQDRAIAKLYGPSAGAARTAGSIESAVAGYVQRRVAAFNFRDDAANVAAARAEGRRIEAWAEKHKISASDLATALAVVWEHESTHALKPTSQEAINARTVNSVEAIRIRLGADAKGALERYDRLTRAVQQELPELFERARQNGAAVDLRVIDALSHYEPVTTAPPTAANAAA